MKKRFNFINKRFKFILLVLVMVFSMFSQSLSIVNAAQSYTGPFTRVKEIKYPSWWAEKIPGVKNWSTWMCTFDGQYSYCLEASKNSPQSEIKSASVLVNSNDMVLKLLYYGFGGLDQKVFNDENDETAYLYTHVLLSYAYSGDMCGANLDKLESLGIGLKGAYNYVASLPTPKTPSLSGDLKAIYDHVNKVQRTNTITFDAISNATINVILQDNVTLHNVSTNMNSTGVVTVKGGESFYLTAPMNVQGSFVSGNIAGVNCERFVPLAISSGNTVQTHGSWTKDPAYVEYKVDWIDTGSLELNKTNDHKDLIDGAVFNLKSVSFDGYNENIVVKDGRIKLDNLPIGTYELKETLAPDGYLLNTEIFKITINKDEKTTQVIENKEPTGSITLIKEINTELTEDKLGEAFLKGNEYRLIARENITNKAGTVTYFNKGELVDTQITDMEGKLLFDNLHIGKYYIEETKSNESLVLNPEDINVDIEYEGQTISKVLRSTNSNNRVNMQKIQVHKFGEKDGVSGIVNGLQGAEFTFKLKADVEQLGWGDAIVYDVITTDENGKANTKYLPYGTYLVKETKTPKDYLTAPDFIVSVSKDYSEYIDVEQIKIIDINNRPNTTQLKLVKKDLNSDKIVTLNSATFKVKAREDIVSNGKIIYKAGETIKQKISGKMYDSFTTNANNVVVSTDSFINGDCNQGSIVLPLELNVGKYYIDEIKTPIGFLSLEKPIDFIIENIRDYDKDQDGDSILEVVVKNDKPMGTLEILKEIEVNSVDKSLIDIKDLSKIKFKLTAKEDILDMADGSIIYAKNAVVGEYYLTKDGKLTIEKLPMGIYELQEISTLEGLVLDGTRYEVEFIQNDLTTKVYTITQKIVNKATLIELSKKSITGKDELKGASMQLLDSNRNIICEWISGDKPYIIEGVAVGKTYILKEDLAPLGYTKAKEISFIVENTSEIQKVDMIDKVVTVKKSNTLGNAVEGTVLQVISKRTKDIVDQWIVDISGKHKVNGLIVGEDYVLKEIKAPDGYILSEDIEFSVRDDKTDQIIEMINNFISVEKKDEKGASLKGAVLQVIAADTEEVVDNWISGEHIFDLSDEMKISLQRGEIIDGQDDFSKYYRIKPNNDGSSYQLMLQENGETCYYNVDIDGNETSHLIRGIKENSKYILREVSAPLGYLLADDIEFVASNKDVCLTMIDKLLPFQPKTGDNLDMAMFFVLGGGVALLGKYLCFKRKIMDRNRHTE